MGSFFRGIQRFRLLVLAVAAGLLALGVGQLRQAPVDVLPEFSPPYAEIQTEALGLSADEVEQLITVPLEADLLNGVEGVETIRSSSLPGLSSVVLVFARGTDIYQARQLVEERLTQAHALPNVSKPPTLLQPLSSSNRVMAIELSSDEVSDIELSVIARWTMRPRLLGVPGVANVAVWGMRDQQLQVLVDPARLKAKGVTLNQVIRSAGNAQVVSPLTFLEASTPGTGGFIETPQQRLQVRHVLEKIADPVELGKVPVDGTGGTLRLADVATVRVGHQPLIGDAVVSGGKGLVLVVEKFPGAGTTQVTQDVEKALAGLGPGLAGITVDTSLFRPASYISDAVDEVGMALGAGIVLALVLLALLRLPWRGVLLGALSVPVSVVTAALVLQWMGEGVNALVVAGLAVGVAVVVDDAVVLVQRVMQRLRSRYPGELRPDGEGEPVAAVVGRTLRQADGLLVYGTLVGLLAVLPVAVLGGRPGSFFAPVVRAYAVSLVVALAVSVTLVTVLSALLFASWRPAARRSRVAPAYGALLARFSGRLRTALVAGGACLLLGVAMLPLLDRAVVPTFQDRNVLVSLQGEPGVSSERMTKVATELGRTLQGIPGVDRVGSYVGRAVTGDRVANVSSSDVWVSIDPAADYGATLRAVRAAARQIQGARADVTTYLAQKVRDVGALTDGGNRVQGSSLDLITGSDQPLLVRVYGEDPAVLRREAARVRNAVAEVDGVRAPRVALPQQESSIEIEVDLDRAQQLGTTPGDVRRSAAVLLQGIQVGSVFQEQKVFDVLVQGEPRVRGSVDSVRNLLIDLPGGGQTRLGNVAAVRVTQSSSVIRRESVSRYLDIDVPVSGRSTGAVADDIDKALAGLSLPLAYHAEVIRESTAEEIGGFRVAATALAVLIGVFLLLQAAFRSWRYAVLGFATVPVALAGGLVAAVIGSGELSLGALLGLLALAVLVTRGVLLLVSTVQSPVEGVMPTSYAERVQFAAGERLGAVLTTNALLAALALPLVVLGTRPGLEVLHPMAVVLLGGLVTATFSVLLLLPALCAGTRRVSHATPLVVPDDHLLVVDLTTAQPSMSEASVVRGNGAPQ